MKGPRQATNDCNLSGITSLYPDIHPQWCGQLHCIDHPLPLLHLDELLLDAGRGIVSLYAGGQDLLGGQSAIQYLRLHRLG